MVVEHVLGESAEGLEVRDELPQETCVFLLEELDVGDDFVVHFLSYFTLDGFWKLVEDLFSFAEIQLVPTIVLKKILNYINDLLRQMCPFRVVIKCLKLDI